MRKTKVITKLDVIQALKKEPSIYRGQFFLSNSSSGEEEYKPNCKVCAVGAVLRYCSFETWMRKINQDLDSWLNGYNNDCVEWIGANYDELLENNQWLAALSNYFESGHSKNACIAFVKKNFPVSFKLTLEF